MGTCKATIGWIRSWLPANPVAPMNMMAGCMLFAILKSMRTSFSDSPCHREVSDAAEMLKKVALASAASACYTYTPKVTARSRRCACFPHGPICGNS